MHTPTSLDDILSQRHDAQRAVVNVDEPQLKLVVFALGGQWFAFHGSSVREILAQPTVHFVPGCPSSLEGVIHVRGDIESVLRLHELLHLPAPANPTGSSIVLGEGAGVRSGLRVDRVIDVVDLPQSALQPPPATLAAPLRTLVLGVLSLQGQAVTLLDLERLLGDYVQTLG